MEFLFKVSLNLSLFDNKMWDSVNNSMKKGFESEPVHNKKYFKNYNKIL